MNYFTDNAPTEPPKIRPVNSAPSARERRGARMNWLLKNSNTISALLILTICSFVLFVAEFNLDKTSIGRNAISVTAVILLFATYTLYLNGFGIGKDKNEVAQTTKDVYDVYNKRIKEVREGDKILILDEFREHYIANELKETKEAMLQAVDLNLVDYERIREGKSTLQLTKKQAKVVARVAEVKPIRLTRQMILSCRPYSSRRNPIQDARAIEADKIVHFATKFISATLMSMFAVSIGVDLLLNMSWELVIHSIIKVSLLVFSLFSGMRVGRKYSEAYVDRTRDILGLLDEFEDYIRLKK